MHPKARAARATGAWPKGWLHPLVREAEFAGLGQSWGNPGLWDSARAHHGTFSTVPPDTSAMTADAWEWVPELGRPGITHDGVDDYVQIETSAVLAGDQELTIAAWVRLDNLDDSQAPIFGEFHVANAHTKNYLFVNNQGRLQFDQFTPSGGLFQSAASAIMAGQLHHVACTLDGTNRTLYIDGLNVASDSSIESYTGSAPDSAGIGNRDRASGNQGSWTGLIADLMLWNRALSQAEIFMISDKMWQPLVIPRRRMMTAPAAAVDGLAGLIFLTGEME